MDERSLFSARVLQTSMRRIHWFVVLIIASFASCNNDTANAAPTPSAPQRAADGSRLVPVEAGSSYKPSTIEATPGEKLTLAVKLTADGCISTFRSPDGTKTKLTKGKVTEISVTAPASGEWHFGCDMEHCHAGKIVVK